MDSGLIVPSFLPSDDPIASLKKAMAFTSTSFASRYPPTNNQLRTSSNLRNQSSIKDGRVTVQSVQGRQTQGQYTKPKRPRNSTWFKEQAMLAEALELGVVLDEEQMAFLADNEDTLHLQVLSIWLRFPHMIQMFSQRNAKVMDFKNQIHSLQLQLNATVKSHKTLSTIVDVLKKESKAKEDKHPEEIIELEKKKKALDNVVYKIGQSTQTMHMLTKPQAFYDESHKTALGYQNLLYLTQTQRKVHALYYGRTIVKQHDALSVIDTEETLVLAEESRLKMHYKQNDPIAKEKKVNTAPIDYAALNKLSEQFVKHFVP
ncbi:hypothetical protein Tco_0702255 [Tanacetum coccineum]|uniref:Uncharacterized protein n=1 Tax=Tanacetum coccineum TaxID=301880 RepID=A0ABQ4XVH1_9ASTR